MTFKALEAPYFFRETVLQYPGCRHTNKEAMLVPEEFVTEESVNLSVDEGDNANNKTLITSNLRAPHQEEDPSETTWCGPLTFNPSPRWRRERAPSLLPPMNS
jgi:hypothetical protein